MRLTERQVGGVTVIDVSDTITADEGEILRKAVVRLLDAGQRQIVLDLAQLTYIDSTALGNLVASQIRAERTGTTLRLANIGKRLQDLLILTRLLSVFECHATLEDALASFGDRR